MKVKINHYIARLSGSEELLKNNLLLKQYLLESAWEGKLSVISNTYHEFYPQGLSMVILLAESHISIHTYPELGFCDLDFYTCNDKVSNEEIIKTFAKKCKLKVQNISKIDRE
jgi:S-adenosylmethionine decarboxylase proenzyme